jgi:hypothetical protein
MSEIKTIEKEKEPKLTLRNVANLTTYEIRQELNRRNAMDLEEGNIHFKTLLQRLVQELVKEEENNTVEHTTVVIDQAQAKSNITNFLSLYLHLMSLFSIYLSYI